jgi:hypothetical protein
MNACALCSGLLAAVVLAGCSGKPAPLDPKKQCVQEFIQDFIVEDTEPMRRGVYCPGEEERYPRDTRRSSRKIHTEFSNGDAYTRQTLVRWYGESDPAQGDCLRILRRETVVEYSEEDGHNELRATVNGVRVKNREELQRLRSSLLYFDVYVGGLAPIRGEADATDIEQTEFGLECANVTHGIGMSDGTSRICAPVAPMARCDGFAKMMPIRQSGRMGGDMVEGRTTLLKFGSKGSVVDKSDWMD